MAKDKVQIRELMKFSPYELLKGLKNDLNILWEDNVVTPIHAKEIIVTRYALDILKDFPNIPLVSKYKLSNYYNNGIYVSKTINNLYEVIVKDVIDIMVRPTNNREPLRTLYRNMYVAINNIYNEVIYDILEYVSSLDILDFTEVQVREELLKAMVDVKNNPTQQSIKDCYNVLDDLLRNDPEITKNKLSRGYISGTFSANQLKQILGPRGYGTEIDSQIFKTPIATSFCVGLNNIYDISVESRSAAKALFLSNKAIQNSEYFARELQLVAMRIENLVDGDCGNHDYIDWYVRPKSDEQKSDLPNLLGKYYYNPETKQEEEITKNHTHLEGTTIKLRSAMNCKCKDANTVCTKCFGTISYNLFKHTNLGHVSVTSLTQKVSQSILSTKHLVASATTAAIQLDENASQFFNVVNSNNFAFKKDVIRNKKIKLTMLFNQWEASGIKDLNPSVDVSKLYPEKISWLRNIEIMKTDENGVVELYPISIAEGKTKGSFTHKFLEYILKNGYTLNSQDKYEVDLTEWNSDAPIISVPQVEFSFVDLLRQLQNIFKHGSKDGKGKASDVKLTKEAFLQFVFDIVNKKLDVNIALIEIIIYAFTVVDRANRDFRLGRGVENPDIVRIKDVMPNNSLGGAYAWESVKKIMLSPTSFNSNNNIDHIMDVMIRPQDVLKSKGIPISYKDKQNIK